MWMRDVCAVLCFAPQYGRPPPLCADAYISKKHSEAEPGLDSPGVGDYKLGRELLDPKGGAHFGTATKDLQPSAATLTHIQFPTAL
jgi:hypothetical protein